MANSIQNSGTDISTTVTLKDGPKVGQVLVNLTTRQPDIAISTPPLLVPTSLKRYGLSGVVNHLLSTDKPIPFDFLIDGVFLRSSLDEYLSSNGLTAETTIELEYVRSILPPLYLASWEQNDWISSVHILSGGGEGGQLSGSERVLSGSYDSVALVLDLSGQIVAQAVGHTSSIKTARWVRANDTAAAELQFITGGMDRSVRLWSCPAHSDMAVEEVQAMAVAEFVGHKSTVEDICVDPSTARILSASSDQTVAIWSLDLSEGAEAPDTVYTPSTRVAKKRRKSKSTSSGVRKMPLAVMSAHSGAVSSVVFDSKDATAGYSVSWDHTIVTHDLVTAKTVDTRTTQHPLLSVTCMDSLSLLAAGSAARHITLHDPRASATTVATSVLRGHTNGVVSVVQSPESEFMLASGSHDGTVRVWDVRAVGGSGSGGSVYTIKRESGSGKVFSVDWRKDVGIVSGGEDKKVQVNKGEGLANAQVL